MKIYVASAVGSGPTRLAAFDAALNATGVANFNLIRLSSVIPPNASVLEADAVPAFQDSQWGDRLHVVYAEQRTDVIGEAAWAGIGWVQDPSDGKGLFVEHEGTSEEQVRADIAASLSALMLTRGMDPLPVHMKVVGGVCAAEPICAFVVASYETTAWRS